MLLFECVSSFLNLQYIEMNLNQADNVKHENEKHRLQMKNTQSKYLRVNLIVRGTSKGECCF